MRYEVSAFATQRYGHHPWHGWRVYDKDTSEFLAVFRDEHDARALARILNDHVAPTKADLREN